MSALAAPEAIVAQGLTGKTKPRLWTRPLRRLTEKTTKGFACIRFAESLGVQLLPWQKWLLIHALELNPDGTYRFRTVVVLVSRQNGKTTVLKVLALWRMLEDGGRMVLGTSTNLEYAREAWAGSVELLEAADEMEGRKPFRVGWHGDQGQPALEGFPQVSASREQRHLSRIRSVKYGALDTSLTLANGARYKVASASRRGGRSLSVDLGIADELREHPDWAAWSALSGTTTARPDPQIWALSNAGDDTSVVLNFLVAQAEAAIEAGDQSGDVALFGWTATPDCDLLDRREWAQANPSLGYTITEATLVGKAKLPSEVFRTEHLCQRVESGNPAVSPAAWKDGGDAGGTMDAHRKRLVAALEVSPDLRHVSLLVGALLSDGRVRVETAGVWSSTSAALAALEGPGGLVAKIRPKAFGWISNGPAAAMGPDLEKIRGSVAIGGGEVPGLCQAFAELVESRRLLHSDDPMLTAQVLGAHKTPAGDGWRFTRKGVGHVDAAYAAAVVAHLARTKLTQVGKPRVLMPSHT